MNIGDIVFFRYEPKKGFWHFFYKMVDVVDGKAHHCAIAYDENRVLEIMDGIGVRIRRIYDTDIVCVCETKYNIKQSELENYYKLEKNTKYSYSDFFRSAANRIIEKMFGHTWYIGNNRGKICSEFVNCFFHKYKYDMLVDDIHNLTPNHILNSNKLKIKEKWRRWNSGN